MTKYRLTYRLCIALLLCLVQTAGIAVYGQNRPRAAAKRTHQLQGTDTLRALTHATDSMPLLRAVVPDTARVEAPETAADSIAVADSLAEENRRFMRETGRVLFLDVPVAELVRRLSRNPLEAQRPSLTGKSLTEEVAEVLAQRLPLYEEAHHRLDAARPLRDVCAQALALLAQAVA